MSREVSSFRPEDLSLALDTVIKKSEPLSPATEKVVTIVKELILFSPQTQSGSDVSKKKRLTPISLETKTYTFTLDDKQTKAFKIQNQIFVSKKLKEALDETDEDIVMPDGQVFNKDTEVVVFEDESLEFLENFIPQFVKEAQLLQKNEKRANEGNREDRKETKSHGKGKSAAQEIQTFERKRNIELEAQVSTQNAAMKGYRTANERAKEADRRQREAAETHRRNKAVTQQRDGSYRERMEANVQDTRKADTIHKGHVSPQHRKPSNKPRKAQ